jgi:DNA replication protein DnaC
MSRPTTELTHLFRQLKDQAAARALPKLADRARAEDWSYEQFAAVLLKTETDSRRQRERRAVGPARHRQDTPLDRAGASCHLGGRHRGSARDLRRHSLYVGA